MKIMKMSEAEMLDLGLSDYPEEVITDELLADLQKEPNKMFH